MKKKTDYNLFNIVLECGFNSASSFHRVCVKFTGKPHAILKFIFNLTKVQVLQFCKNQKDNQILKEFRKRLLEFKI
ncbi:hypothetical protein LEP1GSC081_1324 [Leptospira kirschneri str. H1]|uniref:Uncharacterized protein n=1 Tax=Leptospira kirschneri str. H1 TaxID=1049966 RepID=A0A0E2BGS5_9LEPT|nr:hypothetical protein LEP1GSC081_1324 [Leptospira kirschneri str. H1]